MKAKRTRIAPNIYQYPDGRYEVRVTALGREAPPTRFPAETPLAQVAKWRDEARRRLEQEARELGEVPETVTGTLRGEAADFFAQIGGRPSTAADISHLRAWFDVRIDGVVFGDLPLRAVTHQHVNKVIAHWKKAPSPHAIRRVRIVGYTRKGRTIEDHERRAPATSGHVVSTLTIRHRCRVLHDFFRTKYPAAVSPVAGAKVPEREKRPVITVPPEVLLAVLEQLAVRDPKTYGRFYVHATTGQRPCQIGRAQPDDVQLRAGTHGLRRPVAVWLVRDAKGEPAHSIILNESQLAAWQAFITADAWGAFDTTRYGNVIHAAGWPHGIRPYAARHSLAKAALQAGAHLNDITALFGHSDQNTTRRNYAPFQLEEQIGISERLAGYLKDVQKPRLVKK
jgi:integrase